jgi:hypothetical protein
LRRELWDVVFLGAFLVVLWASRRMKAAASSSPMPTPAAAADAHAVPLRLVLEPLVLHTPGVGGGRRTEPRMMFHLRKHRPPGRGER